MFGSESGHVPQTRCETETHFFFFLFLQVQCTGATGFWCSRWVGQTLDGRGVARKASGE